ncbi:IS110 family transposase [Clostridium butyricum]|uniref:Transposase IS116/IS110/IS902 family protein n=7 Tax=root TaxID=1 RepID=W1YFH8_9ZZZZ|nr:MULTISPECIES: IS110 family transposase [Clostridium]EMU52661.1 transposase IS116/IS110/IS902 family protein [Clostridium butyricum DKU-01]MDU1007362.1 IS110 family transposase [Clostridium butyricum]MDU5177054.1 IS110 family transposase [Clostridium sp.]MDU5724321.1 IS110 family transposase [Clostridium butyricum]RQN01266.1 IS110 family transposase [Clostridium butyricum]
MSKFFNSPVVGIDVSADFSYAAILAPNGDVYKKSFKIKHDAKGFDHLVNEIKKVEKEFNMKTGIFMESTGVYHLSLFHYLNNNFDNTFVINPLVTKCNKNVDIRKVKNDKKDALFIANIGKFQNIKLSQTNNLAIFLLKNLVREYYKLTDTCSTFKKKLSADLRVIFPNYNTVFSDSTSNTSLEILSNYPTPKSVINAPKEDVIKILIEKSKKGVTWSENIYLKLISIAKEANIIGVPLSGLAIKISSSLVLIKAFESQIEDLLNEINTLIESSEFPESIKENIELINSIPGIGRLTAITLIAEIGDIDGFIKPKHLVAFFGIDSSVNQSGKFLGDQSKISKRGTRIGRRALYAVALASIRRSRAGIPINKVLLEYYQVNLKGKKAKVALVAIMHKILNYIFAVLRNQTPFEQRDPKIHKQMFLENKHLHNVA